MCSEKKNSDAILNIDVKIYLGHYKGDSEKRSGC